MIAICRQRGDEASAAFWEYYGSMTTKLGDAGMSDEDEDDNDDNYRSPSGAHIPVRKVLVLTWRNTYIGDLYEAVDEVPSIESWFFHTRGPQKLQRIRVNTASQRPAPKNMARSFFDADFLDTLMPWDIDQLRIKETTFTFKNWTVQNGRFYLVD